jgi:hypothetical protein
MELRMEDSMSSKTWKLNSLRWASNLTKRRLKHYLIRKLRKELKVFFLSCTSKLERKKRTLMTSMW